MIEQAWESLVVSYVGVSGTDELSTGRGVWDSEHEDLKISRASRDFL
mgnify:CR=1 FL=1